MIEHFLKDKMSRILAFLWGILLFTSLILQSPTTHRYLQQLGYGLITILDSEGVNSTYKPNEFWVYKAMQVFL